MKKISNLYAPVLLTVGGLLLSSCGSFGSIEPKEGTSMPVKAYGQTEEQSVERLLRTSPQARPNREQEILSRSTVRTEDPFDLPPEGIVPSFPEDLGPLSEEDILDEPVQ